MDQFWSQCDPNKENLCLYGYSDGTWEVTLPCEEVPPELPEPSLGINFARDGALLLRALPLLPPVEHCGAGPPLACACGFINRRAWVLQRHVFFELSGHVNRAAINLLAAVFDCRRPACLPFSAGMKRPDWLCLVAVHADCWLMATTFYNGAKLDQKGRQRLFEEINGLPTVCEIVSGRISGKPGADLHDIAAAQEVSRAACLAA